MFWPPVDQSGTFVTVTRNLFRHSAGNLRLKAIVLALRKALPACYSTLKVVVMELQHVLMLAAVFVFAALGVAAALAVLCIATEGCAAALKPESHRLPPSPA